MADSEIQIYNELVRVNRTLNELINFFKKTSQYDLNTQTLKYQTVNTDTGLNQPLTDDELRASPVDVTMSLPAGASTEATLLLVKNAVEIIDNFISGSRGLVTEDNSAAILTAIGNVLSALSATLTVSGTVTANAGTNLNTSLLATEASLLLAVANLNSIVTPTAVYTGQTNVTTAGTRVVLSSSQAVKSVTIKALSTNTGFIYVGNSGVTSANGFRLSAGDTVSLDLTNLATVYIDSSVNGEGVTYLGNG